MCLGEGQTLGNCYPADFTFEWTNSLGEVLSSEMYLEVYPQTTTVYQLCIFDGNDIPLANETWILYVIEGINLEFEVSDFIEMQNYSSIVQLIGSQLDFIVDGSSINIDFEYLNEFNAWRPFNSVFFSGSTFHVFDDFNIPGIEPDEHILDVRYILTIENDNQETIFCSNEVVFDNVHTIYGFKVDEISSYQIPNSQGKVIVDEFIKYSASAPNFLTNWNWYFSKTFGNGEFIWKTNGGNSKQGTDLIIKEESLLEIEENEYFGDDYGDLSVSFSYPAPYDYIEFDVTYTVQIYYKSNGIHPAYPEDDKVVNWYVFYRDEFVKTEDTPQFNYEDRITYDPIDVAIPNMARTSSEDVGDGGTAECYISMKYADMHVFPKDKQFNVEVVGGPLQHSIYKGNQPINPPEIFLGNFYTAFYTTIKHEDYHAFEQYYPWDANTGCNSEDKDCDGIIDSKEILGTIPGFGGIKKTVTQSACDINVERGIFSCAFNHMEYIGLPQLEENCTWVNGEIPVSLHLLMIQRYGDFEVTPRTTEYYKDFINNIDSSQDWAFPGSNWNN